MGPLKKENMDNQNNSGVPLTKRERRRLKREQKRGVEQAVVSRERRGRWGWWFLITVALAAAVYGLFTFTQYALAPYPYGYYSNTLALVVLIVFWLKRILDIIPRDFRVRVRWAMCIVAVVALLTNSLFLQSAHL